jgi:hypothetical protein
VNVNKSLVLSCLLASCTASAAPPLHYSVRDLCAPDTCYMNVLNDRGWVAGVGPVQIQFASGPVVVILPTGERINVGAQTFGDSIVIHTGPEYMNNSGVIVSSIIDRCPGGCSANPRDQFGGRAFLYVPSGPSHYEIYWLDESPVSVTGGGRRYISDGGNVAGGGFPIPPSTIPGITLTRLQAITDAGIVIGAQGGLAPFFAGSVVYTPGVTADTFDRYTDIFNNRGQLVFITDEKDPDAPPSFYTPRKQLLYTPGKGTISIPSPENGARANSISDTGLILYTGGVISTDNYIYDSTGAIGEISKRPVSLNTLIDPGWDILGAEVVNSPGQILAVARESSTGRSTSVLLTPTVTSE